MWTSFQIRSIGFISGVYGGMYCKITLFGTSSVEDQSSGYFLDSSLRNRSMHTVFRLVDASEASPVLEHEPGTLACGKLCVSDSVANFSRLNDLLTCFLWAPASRHHIAPALTVQNKIYLAVPDTMISFD